MIYYYTNRQISNKLEINLARWKRWSRDFLPPDPLGGMQSGYARQYLFKDVFKVYLGGHLLSHHKLSVSESRHVLADLTPWLKKTGFLEIPGNGQRTSENGKDDGPVMVYFSPLPPSDLKARTGFDYRIHRLVGGLGDHRGHLDVRQCGLNGQPSDSAAFFAQPQIRLINITALRAALIDGLEAHG